MDKTIVGLAAVEQVKTLSDRYYELLVIVGADNNAEARRKLTYERDRYAEIERQRTALVNATGEQGWDNAVKAIKRMREELNLQARYEAYGAAGLQGIKAVAPGEGWNGSDRTFPEPPPMPPLPEGIGRLPQPPSHSH